MASIKGGDNFLKWAKGLGDKVKANNVLQVGFMKDAVYPDGTQVALVAAVQDFGAPSRGIPPRPFFRNAIAKGKETWPQEAKTLLQKHDYDARGALGELGIAVEGDIKKSINEMYSPPLAPATVRRKGHSKPLVDTGQLLNSVTSRIKE